MARESGGKENPLGRRDLKSRSTAWAQRLAAALSTSAITPNQISLLSLVFAACGGALIFWLDGSWLLLAALCVQLRLLCNLMDGMVAVEGGKASPTGLLYNELPDRVADSLFLVPLGYFLGLGWLGWLLALLAVSTAYLRLLGGALGQAQDFSGIMAKQRRMALLTLGLVLQAAESLLYGTPYSLLVTAILLLLGTALTCVTRTLAIARRLREAG
jgi:phosphatidylglycerophosphate synthase